jgi:RNA polymerase sigma factor (sigma-70 family)
MNDGPSRLSRDDVPRDLAQIYVDYTPLLLSGVATLARKGLDINPGEGLEVIHDFYLEALPGLLERYDASRARFSTYLYGAFLRFARPRIIRSIRWKRLLVPLDDAIEHAAALDEAPSEGAHDAVAAAIEGLPRALRDVLDARLTRHQSERDIAKTLGVSRYVVRQRLAEALGRVAVAIGHSETIRDDLRPLAMRLWRDEVPLMTVAKELGLSRREAWQRFRELIRTLSSAAAAIGRPTS